MKFSFKGLTAHFFVG